MSGDVPLKKFTDFQHPGPVDSKNIGDIPSEFGDESPTNFHTEVLSEEVRHLNPSFTLVILLFFFLKNTN